MVFLKVITLSGFYCEIVVTINFKCSFFYLDCKIAVTINFKCSFFYLHERRICRRAIVPSPVRRMRRERRQTRSVRSVPVGGFQMALTGKMISGLCLDVLDHSVVFRRVVVVVVIVVEVVWAGGLGSFVFDRHGHGCAVSRNWKSPRFLLSSYDFPENVCSHKLLLNKKNLWKTLNFIFLFSFEMQKNTT